MPTHEGLPMRVHLVAVQAAMTLADYLSAESFAARIDALCARAAQGLDGAAKLFAFPEAIGFPLLLALGAGGRPPKAAHETAYAAARALLLRERRGVLAAALRHRTGPLGALYLTRAKEAYLAYRAAFSAAARRYQATIVAGSIFLPQLEEEASRGLYVTSPQVFNTAFTFSPSGRLLDRTTKSYLTPAELRARLRGGSPAGVHTFETPLGRVGVAICLDAFYGSVMDRLDGLGARVVVQPSANHAPWQRAWPADPRHSEESAWFSYGLRAGLQDRLHLQYGVNPMLVGAVYDLEPRGRSSIVANTRFHDTALHDAALEGYPGLLAVAESDDEEEVVCATVELAPRWTGPG